MVGNSGFLYKRLKDDVTVYVLIVCTVVFLVYVCIGNTNSYTSVALPNLNENVNPFHVNSDESSWISSINHLGAIPGSFISVPIADYIGRKPALLLSCLPFTFGWLTITCATNAYVMYVGRFLLGVGQGLTAGMGTVYLVEIAPAKLRGTMAVFINTGHSAGKLFDYVVGAYTSWNWLAVANIGVSTLATICLYFIPETPRWLLSKANLKENSSLKNEAKGILVSARGKDDVSEELSEIDDMLQNSPEQMSWLNFVKKRKHLTNLGICLVILMVYQMGGVIVVTQYTVTIFSAANISMDSNTQTIIVGTMDVVGSIICILTIDVLGRRPMVLFSTSAMTLTMTSIATYFYIEEVHSEFAKEHLSWLPLLSLILFDLLSTCGLGGVIWMIPSELFSTETRSKALSIAVAFCHVCQFVAAKYFIGVTDRIGLYGGFWICAGLDFCGVIFFYFFLPETKKKSLEMLQKQQIKTDKKVDN